MCVKSSSQITLAISCAMGRSKLSGDRHRRSSCQTSPIFSEGRSEGFERSRAAICPNTSSRASTRFSGPRCCKAEALRGLPLCLFTKPRNHSLSDLACAATVSSSPGKAVCLKRLITSNGAKFDSFSHANKSPPEPSHSTGVSTGVAIEFRKSIPLASAIKIGEGRRLLILLRSQQEPVPQHNH